MEESKKAGLPVGGKVPLEVSPTEASNAGQATIDNLETIYDGMFGAAHTRDMAHAMDAFLAPSGDADTVFAIFRRNETAVTPSVAILAYSIAHNDPGTPPDPHYRYVAKSQRRPQKPLPPEDLAEFKAMLPRLMTTISQLQNDGVTLLAGSDVAGGRVPGFSLHDELDMFSQAGLDPLQVLQTATLNPARVMKRTADYGTVESGKLADLVRLGADPTRNAAALHRIEGVSLHGRPLDRAALDALLLDAQREADGD
jgi:hypothetical protein